MTPRERYVQDPTFHFLVDTMFRLFEQHCGSGAGITPTEVREASGLAWQMYAERHLSPPLAVNKPSWGPGHPAYDEMGQ